MCGRTYPPDSSGYLVLTPVPDEPDTSGGLPINSTFEHYAEAQESTNSRLYRSYLRPWLESLGARRVLDAGCGVGVGVAEMLSDGYDAYGFDLPTLAPRWRERGHDPERFVSGTVTALPFLDDSFDAVVTIGVMEHVGTTSGHLTLRSDSDVHRQAFAARAATSVPARWSHPFERTKSVLPHRCPAWSHGRRRHGNAMARLVVLAHRPEPPSHLGSLSPCVLWGYRSLVWTSFVASVANSGLLRFLSVRQPRGATRRHDTPPGPRAALCRRDAASAARDTIEPVRARRGHRIAP